MKAIILAGGYGTRLFPLTLRIPKVMVPVAGKPVLEHLVRVCKNAGIGDIVISLNSNQKAIEEYFGNGGKFGAGISYVYEESESDRDKLGAIGAIQYALEKTGVPKECVVMGGDNVFYGLDLGSIRKFHHEHGAQATIALYSLNDLSDAPQYGIVQVDDSGRITRFKEKPAPSEVFSNKVATAVYHLEEEFLKEYLPAYVEEQSKKGKADKLGDLWTHFLDKIPLYGSTFAGMWGDTNNSHTYIETHKQAMQFTRGSVPSHAQCAVHNPATVIIGEGASVSCDAIVKGPAIIEDDCVVSEGAIIGAGTHLMKGVHVGKGAVVQGSVIFRDCRIGQRARVSESILDIGASVGENAIVDSYSIIGYKSSIASECRVLGESRIWPYCELGPGTSFGGDLMVEESLFKERIKDKLY